MWNLLQNGNLKWCFVPKWGVTYMGSLNVTISGKTCQYWDSNAPHTVSTTIKDDNFPDGSKSAARNFCRNPDPVAKESPWCYTTDKSVEWEICDTCAGKNPTSGDEVAMLYDYGSCGLPKKGTSYMGTLNYSRNYFTCLPWEQFKSSDFVFPDGDAKAASNYCRNPTPKTANGPWCHINGPTGIQREYCDVCKPFAGEVTKTPSSFLDSKMRTGDDNVWHLTTTACIYWCIEILSCVGVDVNPVSSECWYVTSEAGSLRSSDRWDHYSIKRVFPARTNGKPAYFINVQNRMTEHGSSFSAATMKECEEICLNHDRCVILDWNIASECFIHYEIWRPMHITQTVTERFIVRCYKALRSYNISLDTGISSAEQTAMKAHSETSLVSPPPGIDTPINASSSSTPTNSSTLVIVIVVLIVLLFVGIAAAWMIRSSSRKKEAALAASNDEQTKLKATTNLVETGKDPKKSLLRMKSVDKNQTSKRSKTGLASNNASELGTKISNTSKPNLLKKKSSNVISNTEAAAEANANAQ